MIELANISNDIMSNMEDILIVISILIIGFILGRLSGKLIDFIVNKTGILKIIMGTKIQETTKRTSFTFIGFIKIIVSWTIYLVAIGQAIDILGLESINSFMNNVVSYLPNVVVALTIMILGFIFAEKLVHAIDGYLKESRMPSNEIFINSIRYFIYIVALIMALSQLRVSTDVLLIIAAAISFLACVFVIIGAGDISRNFFSGIQIIRNKSVRVGDYIQTPEIEGIVEEVGIISTTLKTNNGDYLVVPNSKLANNVIMKKNL
ncbi:MAG TPA: mechanosensitive ion channel [Candidatus Methanofastidiosa archaeon]|nr:mechanosensitive ion channel [Candidatus Methanofastidiosa archaeon]HPR40964.1 mechanosensitive ion channel [Candidatus Methanofastidiosa archaeon]